LHTFSSPKSIWKAIFLLALASLALTACGGVAVNNWPGLSHAGNAVYYAQLQLIKIDATNGTQIWRYPEKPDAKNSFIAAPAVHGQQVIAGNMNNEVIAIDDESGIEVWAFRDEQGKGRFIASPLVVNDTVLIPSTDRYLYSLDAKTGQLLWRFKARDALWAGVASDGKMVYLPGTDHYLYAIDLASGKLAWEMDLGGSMLHAPVLAPDGMLYLSTIVQEMIAVDTAQQKVAWRETIEGKVWNPPLLDDGRLIFGTDKNKVYALEAQSGATLWTVNTNGSIIASPVKLGDGYLFGAENGEVFTLSREGVPGWTRTLKGKIYSSLSLSENLAAVGGMELEHLLVTFDAQGKQDWTYNPPGN